MYSKLWPIQALNSDTLERQIIENLETTSS